MRRSLFGLGALIVAGMFGGAWHLLQAQAPPRVDPNAYLSPESTLYIRWAGHESSKRDFEKTAAHRALVESGLAEKLIEQVNDQVSRALERTGGGPEAKQIADTVRRVAEHAFHHGVLAAGDFRPFVGEGTFVLPKAAETGLAKEFDGALRKLTRLVGVEIRERKIGNRSIPVAQTQPLTVSWWTEGKDLVLVANMVGPANVVRRIDSGADGLDQTERFKRFRADKPFPVILDCWVDAVPLWAMVPKVPQVQQYLQATGLTTVHGAKFAMGYEGDAVRADYDLLVRSRRTGLLKLLDVSGLRFRQLPKLPSDTAALFGFSLDGAHIFDTIFETSQEVTRAIGLGSSDDGMRKFEEENGFALRDEFAATIGPVGLTFLSPMQGPFGLGGACMAFGVKDKDTLHQTLEIIAERIVQEGRDDIVIERRAVRGANLWVGNYPQGAPELKPTIALSDRWLVIGFLSPEPVERFLALQQGEGEPWSMPDRLTELLRKADGSIATITYADPKPLAEIVSAFAPMLAERARKGGLDANIDFTKLPPIDRVTGDLFPMVAVTTVDEKGLHGMSESSLPLLGPGSGEAAAFAVAAGSVLVSRTMGSREAARMGQERNNLRQMGLMLHNYHDTFGAFPRGTAEKGAKLKVEQRLSWMAAGLPFVDRGNLYEKLAFDKPWDGPKNKPAAESSLAGFLNADIALGAKKNVTHYVGMAGVGAKAPFLKKVTDKGAGVFGYDRVTGIRDIKDGTSNTMMVIGVNKDLGPWAQGGKSTIRALTKKPYINGPDGFGGGQKGGVSVLFCDGSVRFIAKDFDPAVMEAMATIQGKELIERGAVPKER